MTTKPADGSEYIGAGENSSQSRFITGLLQKTERLFEMPATDSPTLPERWLAQTRIRSWPLASLAAGVLFYLLFLAAAYVDGFAVVTFNHNGAWWNSLIPPAMLIYLLLIIPILRRSLGRAIGIFHGLIPFNDRFLRLEAAAYILNPRLEWIAVGLGTLAGWFLIRPLWDPTHVAALLYDLVGDVLIFGLIGWHIYAALARTKLLTKMHGYVQNLDLFQQATPSGPIIRWGLSVIACIIVGSMIMVWLVPRANLLTSTSIIILTGLGISAVLVLAFGKLPDSLRSQLRVFRALTLFVIVAGVGTIGFNQLEGWDLPESFYATVITMTTIGYGDYSPQSAEGRVFTIFLSLFAIGIGGYAVTSLASFVIEGKLHRFIQGKKVDKQIVQMKKHYILCGVGRMGKQIAVEFYKSKVPFVAIDRSFVEVEEFLREVNVPYLEGDATQDETLHLAGVERASGLVAALSDDKDNVFIVLSARSLNPNLRIISRMSLEKNRKKLEKAGADVVISPSAVSGRRMVAEMLHSEVVTLLDEMLRAEQQTGQTLRLEELRVDQIKVPALVDRLHQGKLTITDIGQRTELMVVAIKREQQLASGDPYIYTPRGNTKIQPGDVLLVIATPEQRLKLQHDVLTQNSFGLWLSNVIGSQ